MMHIELFSSFLKRPVAMNTRDSTAPQRNKYAVAFLNRSARGDPAGISDLHFTLATDSYLVLAMCGG